MTEYSALPESLLSALAARLAEAEHRADLSQQNAIRKEIADVLCAIRDSAPDVYHKYIGLGVSRGEP